jgi:hypothetical protein
MTWPVVQLIWRQWRNQRIMNWKEAVEGSGRVTLLHFLYRLRRITKIAGQPVSGTDLNLVFPNRKQACQLPVRGVRILTEYERSNKVPKVQSEWAPQYNMADC